MNNFKMAYVILCHKNPHQVNMLIDRLDTDSVEFFVHVDNKSGIEQDITSRNNVHLIKDTVEVIWGHFSQIDCILKSFLEVKEHGYFDYVHVISGQDMPLVSNEEILSFFKENKGLEFVQYWKMSEVENPTGLYNRVSIYYPNFLISRSKSIRILRFIYANVVNMVPILKRNLKHLPKELYKGANWLSITGDCMEYILDFIQRSPKYVEFFKHSLNADEIFFQTIILNSEFKQNVVDDSKRYTKWKPGEYSPTTFTIEDLHDIRSREAGMFWGRKFDIDIDSNVIQQVFKDIDLKRQKANGSI